MTRDENACPAAAQMRRAFSLLAALLFLAIAPPARGQNNFTWNSGEADFVSRRSNMLSDYYVQAAQEVSFQPRWANLGGGLEFDLTTASYTRLFLQERISINQNNDVILRLNHLEYADWQIGQNFINLYFQQRLDHLKWAAGLSYNSVVITGWNNPFRFQHELEQFRVLYAVSYGAALPKKFDFRMGVENFTQFENYGYDQLGPYLEAGYQLSERTRLKAKADFRFIGFGIGLIDLERKTYFVGIEWNNAPRKKQAATGQTPTRTN
jgi:hypothetical protein